MLLLCLPQWVLVVGPSDGWVEAWQWGLILAAVVLASVALAMLVALLLMSRWAPSQAYLLLRVWRSMRAAGPLRCTSSGRDPPAASPVNTPKQC